MIRLMIIALSALGVSNAQTPPQVPENLKAPATEVVLLKTLGRGKQIYACKQKAGADGSFEWVLDRPDAILFDDEGGEFGKHYKGPTWDAADSSKVTGQLLESVSSPKTNAVPWLLLKAASNMGAGIFGRVTYIQRVDTDGGMAPSTGCDKDHVGAENSVPYQADYYFYGAGKSAE